MLNAIAADLTAGRLEVTALIDSRLPSAVAPLTGLTLHEVGDDDLPNLLLELAMEADWVLVIAPETDSILTRCLNWLEPVKRKLLNPDLKFTQLASNKSELFEHLESKGFTQFPRGLNYQSFLDQVAEAPVEFPAVLKPVDGAGSEEIFLIENWSSFNSPLSRSNDLYRLEEFVPGTAVSVSVLCGGDQCEVLTPTVQLFEGAGTDGGTQTVLGGHYVGAKYPIPEGLSRRAVALVCDVLRLLPKTKGYIGLDLVISDSDNACDDRLIEINPRLTMSYSRLTEVYGQSAQWKAQSSGELTSRLGASPASGGTTEASAQTAQESPTPQGSPGAAHPELIGRNLAMRMIDQAIRPVTNSDVICTFRAPDP